MEPYFASASSRKASSADYRATAQAALACLDVDPLDGASHKAATYAFAMLGRFDVASHHAERAACLLPDDANAQRNLALERLRAGRWSEGWHGFAGLHSGVRRPREVSDDCEEWQGDMTPGCRVLLVGDQGLGDQLQMLRIPAILDARGMTVDAVVAPSLWRLTSRCAGVRAAWTGAPPDTYDRWCYLSRAARFSLVSDDAIRRHVPYLACDVLQTEAWQRRLRELDTVDPAGRRRLRVGLVWAGNPAHDADHHRSLAFGQLIPLVRSIDVTWLSLQHGIGPDESPAEADGLDIRFLGRETGSFAHTQGLMHELDLLISVDTSAVHLAGASGLPVWVLVSAATDWRWMAAGCASPWYRSVRIFRQRELDKWGPVLHDVAKALNDMADAGGVSVQPSQGVRHIEAEP